MVIDTEVDGLQRSNPEYSFFASSSVAMLTLSYLSCINIRTYMRVFAVQGPESKAVDNLCAGCRGYIMETLFVRSDRLPGNMRVGSSFAF